MIQRPLRLALVLALAGSAAGQNWSNLGGNSHRNGRSPETGPTAAQFLWTNTDDFSLISWQPVIEGDRVFTVREASFPQDNGPAGDAIVSYDLDDGSELWRTTLPWGGDTSVEWISWIGGVADGQLYASRASNLQPAPIQALDAATGMPLWTSTQTTEAFAGDGIVFAPNGDPIIGDRLSVFRLDKDTGATVWVMNRTCAVSGNCGAAATSSAVYIDEVAPGGQIVTKLDIATGVVLYSSPPMSGFTAQNAPFLSPDGSTVYFSRTQNNAAVDFLFAFDDDGAAFSLSWMTPVRWTTSHEHGIALDGSIYTFTLTDEFVRLSPVDGSVLSTAGVLAPLGSPNLSPKTVVDANGTVYVSNGWASSPSTNGRLWAFTADLSQQLFVQNLDRQNQGGPALGRDGTLVVCDRFGVGALRTDSASFCNGDGGDQMGCTDCPCGNDALAGTNGGCINGVGTSARILRSGTASVANDTLRMEVEDANPLTFAVLTSGDARAPANQANPCFGLNSGVQSINLDGLRCVVQNVQRHGSRPTDLNGDVGNLTNGWGPPNGPPEGLIEQGAFVAGQTRHYQVIYREAPRLVCMTAQNTTNAETVTFSL